MATTPLGPDSAPVTLPYGYPAHMAAIARILGRYPPGDLARFVAVAIDLLDVDCGDPDLEPTGDEQDAAYIEWHTKPSNLRRNGQSEILTGHEDDEEDDAPEEDDHAGQNSEDEQSSGILSYGWWPSGAGCPIADPDYGVNEGL